MRSLKTKITMLATCIIVITIISSAVVGVISINKLGDSSSEQILKLLCETGEKNLDSYFESVEQSVTTVAGIVSSDLEKTEISGLDEHIDRVRSAFNKAVLSTHGVFTYYYRIYPYIEGAPASAKGFWYTNESGDSFEEHEVTDLTIYNLDDTSDPGLVWFTVPKNKGQSIWLPPYITENLDKRVLSYNVPVYRGNTFIGVIGIEIDYMTMKNEVDSIKLYKNGYAFINDAEGNIIYHPYIDVMMMSDDERPLVPNGLLSADQNIKYKFEGVEKQAVWLSLSNGMRLNVTVPMSEINSEWHKMIFITIILSVVLLAAFIFLTMRLTEHITKPLIELTNAAEQVDKGNYDVVLNYNENDEVGVLSRTFDRLIAHLRIYISDLNSLAHTDALTSVKNKSAYDIYVHKLQNKINHAEKSAEFAIVIFDCDDLKLINDRYGHDKGDLYLKNSSAMICHIFQHSPVFRIGGDEFAAILENDDYRERMSLVHLFEKRCEATCVSENEWWEQIRISVGMAVYDPNDDITVDDVARRADKLMYENKYNRKAKRNK